MAYITRALRGIKTVLRDIDRGFAAMHGRAGSAARPQKLVAAPASENGSA